MRRKFACIEVQFEVYPMLLFFNIITIQATLWCFQTWIFTSTISQKDMRMHSFYLLKFNELSIKPLFWKGNWIPRENGPASKNQARIVINEVRDHLNGTYTLKFSFEDYGVLYLYWPWISRESIVSFSKIPPYLFFASSALPSSQNLPSCLIKQFHQLRG